MPHREFIYVGEPVPELNEWDHGAFFLNFQKSILLSLEQRKLLLPHQRERCFAELERQYHQKRKKHRQA